VLGLKHECWPLAGVIFQADPTHSGVPDRCPLLQPLEKEIIHEAGTGERSHLVGSISGDSVR